MFYISGPGGGAGVYLRRTCGSRVPVVAFLTVHSRDKSSAMTPVQEWYSGRAVLVTGGTGFVGKILLEKMLRSLPNLKVLYVLVRAKRGLTPQERIKNILELPVSESGKIESIAIA